MKIRSFDHKVMQVKVKRAGPYFYLLCSLCFLTLGCGNRQVTSPAATILQVADGMGIINGKEVDIHGSAASKSVVGLIVVRGGGESLCTATLISENIALTAAHCVDGSPRQVELVFSHNIRSGSAVARRVVDAYTLHPRWHRPDELGRGDLALVHFVGELPPGYQLAHLASKNLKLQAGDQVTMIGFGVDDGLAGTGSGVLRSTETNIIRDLSTTEVVSDGHKSGVCFGDSGGPSFVKQGNRIVQWGVASSVSAQNCKQYDIHTSLMSYRPWIKRISASLQKKVSTLPTNQTEDRLQ